MSTENILTNTDPPSASASRSPSPEITVAPPSPREESNSSNEFSIEQQPAGTPSKDGESQRRHTNMGLPGHDFTYFLLSEEVILTELSRLSAPKIINNGALHTASLQPHPAKHSQDRLVAEQWDLGERGSWKFRAVFDGHANGDETVDHVFTTLPSKIRSSLTTLSIPHCTNVEAVSSLLQETISAIDNSIKQGVLDLFPSSDYIDQLSDDEIRAIVNDQSTVLPSKIGLPTLANKYAGRGPNNIKVTRAMRGTTVLVVLINSDGGLWTASLGDCQAVLGQKESSFWTTTILSTNHNASEPSEVARLKLDHPGEEESAVAKNRVLGLIAVTRAIGDHQFKLPSIYTKRVFSLTIPGMNRPDHTQIIVKRNLTPPYVSGIPEVKYVKLHDGAREACLFMCSDGLLDLYGGENWQEKHIDIAELCKTWVDLVGEKLDSSSQSFDPKENLALFLLNRGLRGPPRSYTGEIWTSGWMTRPFWWKSCNRCPDIVIVEYVSPLYVFPVLSLCRLVLRSRLLAGGVSVVARAHHCHSLSQPFQLYTPLRSSLIFRILFMASNNTSTETVDLGKVVFGVTEPTFIMEMFVLLFYGIYTMLFGLYVYLQIHQRGQQRYYQISLLLLYLLATMAVVVSILIEKQMTLFTLDLTFTDDLSDPLVASHFISYANLTVAAEGIYVAANIIADALLLYRCYVVWGSKKYVIAGPIVISLVNTVIAIVSAALIKNNAGRLLNTAGVENTSLQAADIISYAFLSVNLFTNLMLTGLIAGRIWWIARDTRRSLGIDNSSDKSIGGIAAMVLESGLLYPVALVVGLALTVPGTVDVQAILTLIVGIAPTLIMVRTDLGISIENASNTDPNETVGLYDLEATGSDPYGTPKEKAYKNFPEFERPAHGYNWTADMKGKAPERDVPETEERSNEITSLSPSDPVRDIDAPPPAFSESQYEGTSTLISSGPPAHRNEKQPQGLIVLNPPTMDE